MIRLSITVGAGLLELDRRHVRSVIRAVGNEVAAVDRALIRRASGSGRLYSKPGGGRYRASAPGEAPVNRTGALANSVVVRPFPSGEGVAVRERAFYALFLEGGAKGGGGNTRHRANILPAGEVNARGRVLRGKNRMKPSAISQKRILLPRPSLQRALEDRAPTIEPRLKEALLQGIRFRRIRP